MGGISNIGMGGLSPELLQQLLEGLGDIDGKKKKEGCEGEGKGKEGCEDKGITSHACTGADAKI